MRQPSPSKPQLFRRSRLLIVGCGDIGQRVARLLRGRLRVLALTSRADHSPALRQLGITPLAGDLDTPASLRRLGALAPRVLHLAPPPTSCGDHDPRTRALLQVLARHRGLCRVVYGSTTGVYGDAGGAQFDETRGVAPATARARRRVDAEQQLRHGSIGGRVRCTILRIPGIYAADRPGGHPRERLLRGTAVLQAGDDVYTNHIHADDLARSCIAALWRGRPQRIVHACDDTDLPMGDYFDLAADLCGLQRPPRISRVEAGAQLSPMQLSFMSESRRLVNRRLKQELRVRLHYPTVVEGLRAGLAQQGCQDEPGPGVAQ